MLRVTILFFSLVLLLSGCTAPKKDFTDNPLEISFDKIQDVTWVKSNWISNFSEKRGGSMQPYLGIRSKSVQIRFKLYSSGTIYFNKAYIMCGSQKPIVRARKAFEDWSKDFGTYGEYADITLSRKQSLEVLNCNSSLTVRLRGSARASEFEYTSAEDVLYYRGLKDLVDYIENLKKEGRVILSN